MSIHVVRQRPQLLFITVLLTALVASWGGAGRADAAELPDLHPWPGAVSGVAVATGSPYVRSVSFANGGGADAVGPLAATVRSSTAVLLQAVTSTAGDCTVQAGAVRCTFATIPAGTDVTVTVTGVHRAAGNATLTATIDAAPGEEHRADNRTEGHVVRVTGPRCTRIGTPDADRLFGTRGADVICAGGGDDTVDGAGGADRVLGGAGDDTLRGGAGADVVDGQLGRDRMFGDAGDDSLTGGEGADTYFGGGGFDLCHGATAEEPESRCEGPLWARDAVELSQRPRTFVYGNTSPMERIRWSTFGRAVATGSGVLGINSCEPSCAEGSLSYVPGTIRLYGHMWCDSRHAYRYVRIESSVRSFTSDFAYACE